MGAPSNIRILQAQPHYQGFVDCGDAENLRSELTRLRAELKAMLAQGVKADDSL